MSSALSDSQLIESLSAINFADRYYAICTKFAHSGPALPVDQQRALVDGLERDFVYNKREKFFTCHTALSADLDVGLNVNLRDSALELVLAITASSTRLGGPFSELAEAVKLLTAPDYRHTPPYPLVKYANLAEARDALVAALELYDAARTALQRRISA
jgi:hypothetical protein